MRGRRDVTSGSQRFDPRMVPQIAAGEFWLPGYGVSGTTTISWAGRNGTNTMSIGASQAYYSDGVHLTDAGYALIASLVLDELERLGWVAAA